MLSAYQHSRHGHILEQYLVPEKLLSEASSGKAVGSFETLFNVRMSLEICGLYAVMQACQIARKSFKTQTRSTTVKQKRRLEELG